MLELGRTPLTSTFEPKAEGTHDEIKFKVFKKTQGQLEWVCKDGLQEGDVQFTIYTTESKPFPPTTEAVPLGRGGALLKAEYYEEDENVPVILYPARELIDNSVRAICRVSEADVENANEAEDGWEAVEQKVKSIPKAIQVFFLEMEDQTTAFVVFDTGVGMGYKAIKENL
jgi:hypothetical protein